MESIYIFLCDTTLNTQRIGILNPNQFLLDAKAKDRTLTDSQISITPSAFLFINKVAEYIIPTSSVKQKESNRLHNTVKIYPIKLVRQIGQLISTASVMPNF
jgi:hypothetical protein